MSWKEYYRTVPESFCRQFGYDLLARIFNDEEKFPLVSKKTLNLVLGGFSPHTQTAPSFIRSCYRLRPDCQDRFFLLDLNKQPLRKAHFNFGSQKDINLVQADLTKLPFTNQSLDLIFLDGTAMFMTDEQVGSFAQEAKRTLTEYGLVISFSRSPFSEYTVPFNNFKDRLVNRVPIYHRSERRYRDLLSPLKIVSCFDCEGNNALVAGRKGNPLAEFFGQPYALEPRPPLSFFKTQTP